MAKTTVDSPNEGLTRHGLKLCDSKTMDFESPGGLGTGEARGAEPLEQQIQGPGRREKACCGKTLGV